MAVRCDNSWTYRDRTLDSRYQWNDKNFNANYGGLPKNVYLHLTDRLYQTLPLYSNLGTTGTYVYATDFDMANKAGIVNGKMAAVMEENRVQLNQKLPNYCQIQKIKIFYEEFEKTPKKSIKRYLYQHA